MSIVDTQTMSNQLAIPVLAVIGVGLIGGSFAAALKQSNQVGKVLGVGRQQYTLTQAKLLGLIDEIVSLEQAAQQADFILIATPVGAITNILKEIQPHIRPNTIITDAGSTKLDIVNQSKEILANKLAQFVPAHPIAGAEKAGPEFAQADLYQDKRVILTPLPENDEMTIAKVINAWELCGAKVTTMDAQTHDQVLASVSHLPHLISSAYMWQVVTSENSSQRLAMAGTGFRDFTRIAAGSSELWRDIFFANRSAILSELESVKNAIDLLQDTLQNNKHEDMQIILERAAVARRFWESRTNLK